MSQVIFLAMPNYHSYHFEEVGKATSWGWQGWEVWRVVKVRHGDNGLRERKLVRNVFSVA